MLFPRRRPRQWQLFTFAMMLAILLTLLCQSKSPYLLRYALPTTTTPVVMNGSTGSGETVGLSNSEPDLATSDLPLRGNDTSTTPFGNGTSTSTSIFSKPASHSSLSSTPTTGISTTTSTTNSSSSFWRPSKEWIKTCVTNTIQSLQKQGDYKTPFQPRWPKYRLGDCVKMCKGCTSSQMEFSYPPSRPTNATHSTSTSIITIMQTDMSNYSTISAQYWDLGCHGKEINRSGQTNLTAVDAIMDQIDKDDDDQHRQYWGRPEEDELVIHLRLGDVLDAPFYSKNATALQMLSEGADIVHGHNSAYPKGVRSLYEYLDLIEESGLTRIAIRGGPHLPGKYPKSKIYSSCLVKAIQATGLYNLTSVDVWGENTPDQDFYFMTHAKHFVVSTGGFSLLIARMVHRKGGRIVGRLMRDLR